MTSFQAALFDRSSSLPSTPADARFHPAIQGYFEALNRGEFAATSQLFAPDGILYPPFEAAIVGREAIATYLQNEATNLVLQPRSCEAQPLSNGCTEYWVSGKVQTPLFSVNVSWQMILSPLSELFVVRVKLLASLQELLHLRQQMRGSIEGVALPKAIS